MLKNKKIAQKVCLAKTFLYICTVNGYCHFYPVNSRSMIAILILILALALLMALERLMGGYHVERLLPNKPIQTGKNVHIYLDGLYNRTATVDSVYVDRFYIYTSLPMGIQYRGRFYAIGRTADGKRLIYVANRNHFHLVRMAEILRAIFAIADNPFCLEPTDSASDTEAITESNEKLLEDEEK